MIELERTFLAKIIPEGLKNCKQVEMIDIYVPKSRVHPTLRIRKQGDKYVVTRKAPVANDSSTMREQTINIGEDEFKELAAVEGKRVHKLRYRFPYKGLTAEIDVFLDKLKGLVLVDFEFKTQRDKQNFVMPDFCLADVTQEEFVAGGMLCGKAYNDIEDKLKRFGYETL
ncbi:MAG: CYTH domain-containing protein [Candidatus Woesearchaeota archaeon]